MGVTATSSSTTQEWVAAWFDHLGAVGGRPWRSSGGSVSFAWPSRRLALALPGETVGGMPDAGWTIVELPNVGTLQAYMALVGQAAVAVRGASGLRDTAATKHPFWALLRFTLDQLGATGHQVIGSSDGSLAIGWQAEQVGLGLPGDDYVGLAKAGWLVRRLPESAQLHSFLDFLADVSFDVVIRRSGVDATNPSKVEQDFGRMLLAAGLPPARRDLNVHDPVTGRLRTIPDFAWEDVRLVAELDGWYFHSDLEALLKTANASKRRGEQIRLGARSKAAKDASKRNLLMSLGWTVMVISDEQVYRGQGPVEAAKVAATYARLKG